MQRNREITTTLLIDADIIAFKFASTAQEVFKWGDGPPSVSVKPIEEVTPLLDDQIRSWKERWKADEVIICLSCPHDENFRLTVLPTYKGNRDYSNRPALLGPLKEYMAKNYRTYSRPTLEADDVMGILSTHPKLVPGRKVIVSEDKDMKTIPGFLWNPAKDPKPRKVSLEDADRWHLYQTTCGDVTDGYSGCPGAGAEAFERVVASGLKYEPYQHTFKSGPRKGKEETRWRLVPSGSAWESVVSLFNKAGLTEEDALIQARVARICRAEDYDFKKKEVRLWTPQ